MYGCRIFPCDKRIEEGITINPNNASGVKQAGLRRVTHTIVSKAQTKQI